MKNPILLLLLLFIASCTSERDTTSNKLSLDSVNSQIISATGIIAGTAVFTETNQGNPVLNWTEGEKENKVLKYSIWNPEQNQFGLPKVVTPSKGLNAHQESMPKVVFKDDGTLVAVYSVKKTTQDNPFAGAIYYTQSFDDGESWSTPEYLHLHSEEGFGRSFFDIARLADGEIGAVWLDGRHKETEGSTLYFRKTSGNDGFAEEVVLGHNTCQCCRTDIFVDKSGAIHIAYRNIFEESIRDIAYISSSDNGLTFSTPAKVSEDNWVINGCPHTGPSIAENNGKLNISWFTAGGKEGVYLTTTDSLGKSFTSRQLIKQEARHPQIAATPKGKLLMVWDEGFRNSDQFTTRITMQIHQNGNHSKALYLSPESSKASHPVIFTDQSGTVLLAWTQEGETTTGVHLLNLTDRI